MNKMLLTAALAGVFAAGVAATAQADDTTKVKCYGIAKAGQNDCAAADKSHSCKTLAKTDNSKVDFKLVADKAACTAANGSVDAPASSKM